MHVVFLRVTEKLINSPGSINSHFKNFKFLYKLENAVLLIFSPAAIRYLVFLRENGN